MFNLELTNRFVRSYKKLDRAIRLQVDKTLQVMVINPSHPSLRLKRVQGTKDIWEASVNMSIRITLSFSEDTIQLRNVGTHEQVFRPPY
ncbi:mRNA-degrading endonuclease (mRNA interferase) YafQ, toxin component of the YafQ-DinJ toxin-antitoxin module [Desulfoscipio geothermicus DSM 3669]|uniref:mRNA-degrading endonuclease (mRNA interferase) YafQ, toxin component of the YafQ-DinJ toxin-antitoxin module n=1 Tax=Desulfoscipio geothermicus DSM 3669 TaxID=1121426 RepID=A0A1I6E8Z0_9FIRM|nr:mRNA-degrading endonuclease (mRNA interferase) YafQ, toxin component of the YafQ-DinJ toxin-antitoxin module [Desulfoscipio geothermicus DSM 3669]